MEKQASAVSLGITALFFLAGIVAGCLAAMRGGGEADKIAVDYLTGFAASGFAGPTYAQAFLQSFSYGLICFLFGLTLLGVLLIPAAVAARGFFLSFAAAACVRVFGADGLLLALALLGIGALLTVPCLFALAAQGGVTSFSLLRSALSGGVRSTAPVFSAPAFKRLGVCMAVMTTAMLAEVFLYRFL